MPVRIVDPWRSLFFGRWLMLGYDGILGRMFVAIPQIGKEIVATGGPGLRRHAEAAAKHGTSRDGGVGRHSRHTAGRARQATVGVPIC